MSEEEKENIKDILKTIIVGIADGSIVSNPKAYRDMVDKELFEELKTKS